MAKFHGGDLEKHPRGGERPGILKGTQGRGIQGQGDWLVIIKFH